MGRGKPKMELVKDEKARAATYKKRITSLQKKAHELSVLCDVRICMVIFKPEFNHSPARVDVWPSDPDQVRNMIATYRRTPISQRKSVGIQYFSELRAKKVYDEIERVREARFKAKFPTWDDRLNDLSPEQLASFISNLDSKIEAGKRKMMTMMGVHDDQGHIMECSKTAPNPYDLIPAAHSENHVQIHVPPKTLNPYNFIQAFPLRNLDYGLPMRQHVVGNLIQSHLPLQTRNPFNHIQAFPLNNLDHGPSMELPPTSAIPLHMQLSSVSPADEASLKLSLSPNLMENWMSTPFDKPLTMKSSMLNVQSGMASSNIDKLLTVPAISNLDFSVHSGMASSSSNVPNFNAQSGMPFSSRNIPNFNVQSGMASSSRNIPNHVIRYTPPPSVSVGHHDPGAALPNYVMSNNLASIPVADRKPMIAMQNNLMFNQPRPYQPRFSPLPMQSDQATDYDRKPCVTIPPEFDLEQLDYLPELQSIYRNIDED